MTATRSTMTQTLKQDIIYGPVRSRRLGNSLGINILPAGAKVCQFNCAYCQYGWTSQFSGVGTMPGVTEIRDAVAETLHRLLREERLPDYVTFSGNGEPTMHPEFPAIVVAINEIRDAVAPAVKTAILSNSTRIAAPSVRGALARLDVRVMKLDCGTQDVLQRYNRPSRGIDINRLTDGLRELARTMPVTLQTLFASGESGNMERANIDRWIERVESIAPAMVQVYTLDRGYPDKRLIPARPEALSSIHSALQARGIMSRVY